MRATLSLNILIVLVASGVINGLAQPDLRMERGGILSATNLLTNGVWLTEVADTVEGPWRPLRNVYTTAMQTSVTLNATGGAAFYKSSVLDISAGRAGFTNLTRAYGLLTTLAGAGGIQDVNHWRPEFEGAPATNVTLSAPHIAIADRRGLIYIADKDAHGIRCVRPDGTIFTVAGTSVAGNGPDTETNATDCALSGPNGLWVKQDGTVFILDVFNHKIRRLATNGTIRTLFSVADTENIQRGLWVSEDETVAYVATYTAVLRWQQGVGVTNFSTGYTECGNITMDPNGFLVVTDRGAHRVYRLDHQGNRTPIAGTGSRSGGGDGQPALATALDGVRGVWFLPNGGYFLCTHKGSQVWYVDPQGTIHLFIHGNSNETHSGDGTWFYNPTQLRVSECRAVTVDYEGNLLVTENDYGYIRKVSFLPMR